jgi:hypothetical protein
MATERARRERGGVGTFERFSDFLVNLRQLAVYLTEMHGTDAGQPTWPFVEDGPVTQAEKAALMAMALKHLDLHASGIPDTEPKCKIPDHQCKALGGARVAFALLTELEDGETGKAAADLHAATEELVGSLMARLAPQLRLATGDGERSASASAGLARTQHDHDDDALLALGAGEWLGLHPSPRKPRCRGNHVATRKPEIGKFHDFE